MGMVEKGESKMETVKEKQVKVGKTILQVVEVYPYRYDHGTGKEVLRIQVTEKNHSFEDLLLLRDCNDTIQYYEDGVCKNEYESYSLDFNCQYQNGTYSIEITRQDETARKIQELNTQLEMTQGVMDLLLLNGGM